MDDSAILQILILFVLLLLSAYFSATETAFSAMNRIRIKNLASEGSRRAARVMRLSENFDRLLSTILIGNNIVNIAATAIATLLFIRVLKGDEGFATMIATVVVTVVVLIFGEITPKTLAKESPERFAMAASGSIQVLCWLLLPLNLIFSGWRKLLFLFFKPKDDKTVTEDELITMVEEAGSEGDMQSNEVELIRNAIEFNDIEVLDVLRPRVEVEAIPLDAEWEEVDRIFRETGYSRLPVYKDTIDGIFGVVNQKDFYMAKKHVLKSIVYPIEFVVPTMKISEVLVVLQKKKAHIAAVVDEYGGIAGIVTLEDIIEELVGEIWDEHDEVIEEFTPLGESEYRVLCGAPLDDMFELFGMDEELDIPTVSGWVLEELKHMPAEGDSFTYKGLDVTVTKCDARHVLEIVVKASEPAEGDTDEKDEPAPDGENE